MPGENLGTTTIPIPSQKVKAYKPTSTTQAVPETYAGNQSRYDDNYFIDQSKMSPEFFQGMRAENQGFGMELATAGANLIPNIALSIGETAGYLFDVEDWSNMIQGNKTDYGNTITKWASENKNPFGQVYTKSTDGGFDMSDSAWWVSNGGGLVESLVAFGITGFGVGSVLGKSASMLSKTLGAYGKTKFAIEGAAKLGTSLSLAYSEGAMTGAQVFKDVYADTYNFEYEKNINAGMGDNEAKARAHYTATDIAGEGATKAVRTNTLINTFLNVPETNVLFRSMGASRYMDDALKLQRGEFARDAVERIKKFDASKHLTRQAIEHKIVETGSEMLEEMVNVYAEEEGKNVGRLATGQDIVSLGDMLANDDIWAAGFWGAVGGSMNGFVMGKMPKWVTQEDGTKKRTTVGAYNKEQVSNKYKEQLTDLQDRLTEFVDARDNLDRASKSGDERAYKEAADKVFSYNSFNSIVKGTEEQLLNDFQEIAAFTPEQAAQQGFASDYKERATQKMQSVRENTAEWNKIQDRHSSQDLDQAGFPETIFQQHMNVQNNKKIIEENTIELAKLEAEISQINTLRGTDLTVTSFNDVLSNIKAVEHTFEMATIDLENILNLDKFDSKTQKRIIAKLSNTYGNIANARQEIEKHLSELNENIADLYNNLEIQKATYYSFIDPDNTMSDKEKEDKYKSTIYQNDADINALAEGKKTLVGNKKILTSQIEELRVLKSKEGLTRFKELKKEKMAEREALDAKVAAAAQAAAAAKAEADALAALKAKKQTAPETVTADEEEIIQATTPVESFEEGGYSGEGSSKEELEKQYDDISDVADNSDVPGEVRDSSGALISVGDRLIEGSNKLAYASTVEYTEDDSGIKHISLKLNPETNPNLLTDKYVPGTKLKIKKLTAEEFKPFVAEKEISFTDEVGRTILVANAGTTVTFEMLSHPYMQPIGIYNEAGEYQAMLHAVSYITPKRIVPQNVDVDLQTLINIRAAVTDNFQDISINSKSNGKLNQLPQFHRLSELIDQTVEFAIATSSIQLNTSKTTPVENLANKKGYKVGQVYAITVMPDGRKLAIPVKTTKVKETPQVIAELMTALDVFLRGGNREDLQNVFGQYLHSTFTSDKLTEDGKSFLADPNGKDRFYIDFTSKNVKGIIFGRSGATKNFISGDSPASDIEKLKAALASIIQESYININFESLKNPDFVKQYVTSNVRFYPLPNGKVTVFDNPVIGFDTSNLLNVTAPAAKVAPAPAPITELERLNNEVIRLVNIRNNDRVVRQAINDSNNKKITLEELDAVMKKWDDENGLTVAIQAYDAEKRKQAPVANALKDVENTAKALEDIKKQTGKPVAFDLLNSPSYGVKYDTGKPTEQIIAEAYHKAKAGDKSWSLLNEANTNNEALIKAVEAVLNPTAVKPEVTPTPTTQSSDIEKDAQGNFIPKKYTLNRKGVNPAPTIPLSSIKEESFGGELPENVSKVRLLEIRGKNSNGITVGTVWIQKEDGQSYTIEAFFNDAELTSLESKQPTTQSVADIKAEIENRIVITGTDGGFEVINTSNIKNEKAGTASDVRRKYSNDKYEIEFGKGDDKKSIFSDINIGEKKSYHYFMTDKKTKKRYYVVGISSRVTGNDPERNGSLFATIEDDGNITDFTRTVLELALIKEFENQTKKRKNIFRPLPQEFIDKVKAAELAALEASPTAEETPTAPQEKGEFSIQGTFRGLTHVLGDPANMIPDLRDTGFIDKPTFSESVQKGKKFFTLSIPQADDVYRQGYLSVSLVFPETTTKTMADVKAALEAKVAEAKAVIATARDKGSNAEAYLKNKVSAEYIEQTPVTETAPIVEPQPTVELKSANGATFTIRLDEDDDLSITTTEELSVKPGVQELFDSNPELASIGTVQEYSQYLDSVFPDSQVKDIVYHGSSYGFEGENFDTSIMTNGRTQGDGVYFSTDRKAVERFADISESMYEMFTAQEMQKYLKVAVVNAEKVIDGNEVIVQPEQIHILGSKQDIDGFKDFAKSGKQIEKYVSLQDKVNNLIEEGKATKFCK
jgi:hypothetical protein